MQSKPAPYSTDQKAITEREKCKYNQKITLEMAESGNAPRKVRIYCDGIYDLFHQGHARQMMQAKNIFPKCDIYLIVGCCCDEVTHLKKGITVLTETERYESIRHCRYVDEVLKDAPWVITEDFLRENKIDFVAQDSVPYVCDGDDIYKLVKELSMFVPTQRTNGISTSDILNRIIKNRDVYVKRNLMRGISAKEMNVSIVTETRIHLQSKYSRFKEFFVGIVQSIWMYLDFSMRQQIENENDKKSIDTNGNYIDDCSTNGITKNHP